MIEELVDRYIAGEHTPALARENGISATGLRTLLLSEGIGFRRQSITPVDSDRAVRLYEDGMKVGDVGKRSDTHSLLSGANSIREACRCAHRGDGITYRRRRNPGLITDCRLRKRAQGTIASWLNGNRFYTARA